MACVESSRQCDIGCQISRWQSGAGRARGDGYAKTGCEQPLVVAAVNTFGCVEDRGDQVFLVNDRIRGDGLVSYVITDSGELWIVRIDELQFAGVADHALHNDAGNTAAFRVDV